MPSPNPIVRSALSAGTVIIWFQSPRHSFWMWLKIRCRVLVNILLNISSFITTFLCYLAQLLGMVIKPTRENPRRHIDLSRSSTMHFITLNHVDFTLHKVGGRKVWRRFRFPFLLFHPNGGSSGGTA